MKAKRQPEFTINDVLITLGGFPAITEARQHLYKFKGALMQFTAKVLKIPKVRNTLFVQINTQQQHQLEGFLHFTDHERERLKALGVKKNSAVSIAATFITAGTRAANLDLVSCQLIVPGKPVKRKRVKTNDVN